MKRKHIILAVLLLSTIIYSCKKNAVQVIATPVSGAQVKFFNFALNVPVVNFYVNDRKASAAASTTGLESATTGVAYAAVYPSINSYAVITPGTFDIKAIRPSTATTDANLVISTLNTTLAQGKNYSLYTSGLYNTTTKSTEAFIVEDALPAIDTSGAYVRLVHASYNALPFNLVMKNNLTLVETTVASNVAYKTASGFTKINSGVYDLILRYPTAPTVNVIVRTAVSVIKSNTYTFSLRGDITLPYTGTATNRPFIDNTPNR
jgi:hypothetical protein